MCLAVPGKIVEITGDDATFRTGRVSFEGVVKNVSLACVPEAGVGDYVLVHVGCALNVIDAADAEEVFDYLRRMGEFPDVAPPVPDRHEVRR